jgi:hypothetical protein
MSQEMSETTNSLRWFWQDFGREPQIEPNPNFPNGVPVDVTHGAAMWCQTDLPYPAKRCGAYIVECISCGKTVLVTTAGRADDPVSVRLACLSKGEAQELGDALAGQTASKNLEIVRTAELKPVTQDDD